MRRLTLLALAAPALSLGAVTTAAPAHAACEPAPLRTSLKAASLVVTGTVDSVQALPGRQVYTVTVKRVYAGAATPTIEFAAPVAGRDCALPVAAGQEWLFLSDAGADVPRPVVRADTGSTLLTPEAGSVVASVLGSGTVPTAGGAAPSGVTMTKLDAPKRAGYWQIALPGAVLAAGGFLVLLLARALGRR